MENRQNKTILFVRMPGLLARSAFNSRTSTNVCCPIVVAEGRLIRDVCPSAIAHGVKVGSSVVQARRLCPTLLAVPINEVDASAARRQFLNILADLSPVVEPDGLDAAYADVTGGRVDTDQLSARLEVLSGLKPILGFGVSRLAARAVAESRVEKLEDASVQWLWPDDPDVVGRLQRLGLLTFGSVAAISEEALRLHFGKIAPLLYRRAQGFDLTPVRALYPPSSIDVSIDCSESPIDNSERLKQVITRLSQRAGYQLSGLGVGRRLILQIQTERGEMRQEWAVPIPVERAVDIQRALWRMLGETRLLAPVMRVRVMIEDVSIPNAHTADLFGVRSDSTALEGVRRRLAARFGLTTLTILGQWPRTPREKRRAAMREAQRVQA